MTFDLIITSIDYVIMIDDEDTRSQFNNYSNNDDDRDFSSMPFIEFKYNQ